ncbi:MAG: hypothetical protein V1688_03525 [bacterium]
MIIPHTILVYHTNFKFYKKTFGFFPLICYYTDMEESIQKEEETKKESAPKAITPQEVQFYFRYSLYVLALFLFFEFLIMFALSKVAWTGGDIILWFLRIIIFSYILREIDKKFKQLNLSLFGAILGLEVGSVVSVAKIILNGGAGWTWFNLFTEPFYIMGLGAAIGLVFYSLTKK